MDKLLIETYNNNELQLIKEEKQLPSGCLGVLKGICADYKDPTRNGRFYSEKLWRKVFEDERIKEGLATKTLFGELDHPADRLESLAKEAAVVMTDYSFDEKEKQIVGEFYILDTPNGRILNSLAKFGSKMGISSRGRGEINEKDNTVAEDSYIFGGFDVVTLPAIRTARPEYRLTEIKNFSSSIEDEIKDANLEELGKIERIISYTDLPIETMQSLTESIDHRKESFNKSSDNTIVTSNKLQGDLEEAYKTIDELENKLKAKEVVKDIPKEEKLSEGDDDWTGTDAISNEDLYLEFANFKDELEHYRNHQVNLEKLKSCILEKERIIEVLKKETEGMVKGIAEMCDERSELETTISSIKEKYNRVIVEYENLKEDHKSLRENIKEHKTLKESVLDIQAEKDKLASIAEKLKNDKLALADKVDLLAQETEELQSENENLKITNEEFTGSYIELRANQAGLKERAISELLPESYGIDEVEEAISQLYEEKSRTSSLPFNTSTLISLKEQKSEKNDFRNAKTMLSNFKPKQKPEGGNK